MKWLLCLLFVSFLSARAEAAWQARDYEEATTHHGARDRLRQRHPAVKVVDAKVVDLGQLVTAAGVSSGIEGALHVVQRLCGSEVARGVADYMEYRWQPTSQVQGR